MRLGKVDRRRSPRKETQDGGQIMNRDLCAQKCLLTKIYNLGLFLYWEGEHKTDRVNHEA